MTTRQWCRALRLDDGSLFVESHVVYATRAEAAAYTREARSDTPYDAVVYRDVSPWHESLPTDDEGPRQP